MMRNKRSAKAAIGVMVAALLVLGVVGNVIPAFATHVEGSASVDVKETLAGQGVTNFTFTINHPFLQNDPTPLPGDESVSPPINYVRVFAPAGFIPDSTGHTAPHTGWTATVEKVAGVNARVAFTLTSGNGIGATSATATQSFVIKASVPTPAAEVTTAPKGQWQVQVSSESGPNPRNPTPANLLTKVRVLKVMDVALTYPTGVIDNSVTGAQGSRDTNGDGSALDEGDPASDDIIARCSVKNFASVAHTITPSLSGANFSVLKSATAQTVNPGDTGVFEFRLSFADVSSQVSGNAITCNATSVNASGGAGSTPTGFNGQLGVTIQPRAIFTYVAGSNTFLPKAIKPGTNGVQFTALVQKTPANSPALTLDPAATEFALLHKDGSGTIVAGPADLSSSGAVAGGVQAVSLAFTPVDIGAALSSGQYPGRLSIKGTDANDALVEFVPLSSFNEKVRLDNLIPKVLTNLTPLPFPATWPSSTPDFDKVKRAVKGGAGPTIGGSVTDTNVDSGLDEPCGPPVCTIVGAQIRQYANWNGGAEVGTPITVSPSLSGGGAISGSYNGNYDAAARSIRLFVTIRDEAGNEVTQPSTNSADPDNPFVPVDVDVPAMVSAEAVRTYDATGTEHRNTIIVRFNECMTKIATTSPRDWTVEGNVVQSVGDPKCKRVDEGSAQFEGSVEITTLNDLPDDGPYGNINYDPTCTAVCSGAAQKYVDRVSRQIVTPAATAILDKIAPLTPTITAIELSPTKSFGTQDGAYWTNIDAPKFALANPAGQGNRALRRGYTAEIWQEMNGIDGLQRGTGSGFDAKLGDHTISSTECPAATPPQTADPACSTKVTADFTKGDATDTSTTEDDHDIYVVALDGVANVSVAGPAVAEIDKIDPDVLFSETVFGSTKVAVKFNDKVVRGQESESDWALVNTEDVQVTISDIGPGTDQTIRELTPGSFYTGEAGTMYFGYYYVGPAGRYEDRATNTMSNNDRCIKFVVGSIFCPA